MTEACVVRYNTQTEESPIPPVPVFLFAAFLALLGGVVFQPVRLVAIVLIVVGVLMVR
jgi:hypothetical protein